MAALERAFTAPGAAAEAERALAQRPLLHGFALFCALAERHQARLAHVAAPAGATPAGGAAVVGR